MIEAYRYFNDYLQAENLRQSDVDINTAIYEALFDAGFTGHILERARKAVQADDLPDEGFYRNISRIVSEDLLGGSTGPVESIWGFTYPDSPPTSFPGNLIVGDERTATDATKWVRQNSDAALSIAPSNMACDGSNGVLRFIGFSSGIACNAGDRIGLISKIETASGNVSVSTDAGSSTNTSNARIGWKNATRLHSSASASVQPRTQFNAGVAGSFSQMIAYNVTQLAAQKWFMIDVVSQSNWVGSTRVADPAIDTPVEGCLYIPATTNTYVGASAGVPMLVVEPLQHQTLNGSSGAYGGGPNGEFLRELRKHIPADYTIVLNATGYAAAGFKLGALWNKDASPNTAYTGFWAAHNAMVAAAPAGSIYGGVIFCQGESDLGSGNEAEWASTVNGAPALLNEIRAEFPLAPIVIAEIGMDNSLSNVQSMIALQQKLATGSGDPLEFSRCVYVPRPTVWTLTDGTHYDQATDRQRGYDVAQALVSLIYPDL